MLKKLFTTEEFAEEYNQWFGFGVVTWAEPSLSEKVLDFRKDVDSRIHRLDSIFERIELIPTLTPATDDDKKISAESLNMSQIFIVHGRDNEAKHEVARFVQKIGFTPIILSEQASESRTIIEKIEEYSDVGFGVVIYTPCDLGSLKVDDPLLRGRARQNVVFEHGFLIGKLGRKNVCQLVKGDVETPNDISGIVYAHMNYDAWQIQLAKELRAAGYPIDMNKVI